MSKNVVITGTSRGIGFELVKLFSAQGHNVLALSRNIKPIADLQLENVTSMSIDLGVESDYNKVCEFLNFNWNTVDVLINNAGVLINKPFSELNMADFETVYRTNVFGVAELTRRLLNHLKSGSHVVTISSMGGVQGSMKFPGLAAYSSSKAAVITLTELWAEEFKDDGPSFNVLALGAVQTEMLEEAFPGYVAPNSADTMAKYINEFALNGHTFFNGKLLQVSSTTP